MSELEIDGQTYQFGKIDARKQFHIVRRLAPAIASLVGMAALPGPTPAEGDAVVDAAAAPADAPAPNLTQFMGAVQPFAEAIGRMSDTDADYVIDGCLAAVKRRIDGDRGWAAVMAPNGGRLMFDDIDSGLMVRLAFEAARENLQGFFGVMASALPVQKAPQA